MESKIAFYVVVFFWLVQSAAGRSVEVKASGSIQVIQAEPRFYRGQHPVAGHQSGSIPRIIMQTNETSTAKQRLEMEWIGRNPGYVYHFLNDADAMHFLTAEFGSQYFQAFDNLGPGAIKADFLRLAWLYKHGGFYIDVDKDVDDLEKYVSAADVVIPQAIPDNGDRTCQGILYNAFMGVKPRSTFIKTALDVALYRALSNWKAEPDPNFNMVNSHENLRTCYAIAGPVLLGETLCSSLPASTSCGYSGGSVQGLGCRMQQDTRTTLKSGETILVFSEDQLPGYTRFRETWKPGQTNRPLITMRFAGTSNSSAQARHYTDECARGQIYKVVSRKKAKSDQWKLPLR